MEHDQNRIQSNVEVVVGTYEHFLIGYKLKVNGSKFKFEQSFTNRAHAGMIRSVATNSELVASGGSDEVVRVFNMKKRADVGTLMQQEGTINCIEFFENTHVFTASDDGTICVFDTSNWECLKTLRGHKAPVNFMSIHPSGKMCLSVSNDKTLRTWNLIKGRCAYITNLKFIANLVLWSPSGQEFIVTVDNKMDVYSTSSGSVCHSHTFESKITSVVYLSEKIMAVGCERGVISFYCNTKQKVMVEFTAHANRIKQLYWLESQLNSEQVHGYLFSVSSDSLLKLWKVANLNEKPELAADVDIKCRPTCMSVYVTGNLENTETAAVENLEQKENRKRKPKRVEEPKALSGKKNKA